MPSVHVVYDEHDKLHFPPFVPKGLRFASVSVGSLPDDPDEFSQLVSRLAALLLEHVNGDAHPVSRPKMPDLADILEKV